MKKLILCLLPIFTITGCSTPQALVVSGASARMAIDLNSDSVGTNTKTWRVFKYDDETCAKDDKGVLIAQQLFGNSGGALEPVLIPANEKITIGFGYIEARFAQNRECSYTLTFRPAPNEKYVANFSVSGNSQSCNVSLINSAGQAVDASTPIGSCVAGLVGKGKNGQPGVLDWNIKVQAVRTR